MKPLFLVFLLGLSWVSVWGGEADDLEKAFFEAHDQLFATAHAYTKALADLKPPAGFKYSEEDLADYRARLEKLYQSKPRYREMSAQSAQSTKENKELARLLGLDGKSPDVYQVAKDLAHMTGLPHRELAVYQKAEGLYSLRKLVYSVKNLPNLQWVAWYLALTDSSGNVEKELLFLDKGESQPQLAQLRTEFGEKSKIFNQAGKRLWQWNMNALEAAKDPKVKSAVAAKAYIFQYIGKKAGRVSWLSKPREEYPLTDATAKRYPKAAQLSELLGVPFEDLAYIKKKEGNHGLRSLVKGMEWVPDREAIIAEVFDDKKK